MKKLAALLFFFVAAKMAAATAIVIIVTPQYILLGTDSKRQLLNADAVVTANQQVCKIQTVGPYCFALAGYTSSQATHYSASAIVARHLQAGGDYTSAIQAIKKDLKAVLTKDLRYKQQAQPATYEQVAAATEPLLELVVLRMHNGVPQMEIIGFEKKGDNNIVVGSYTARCPGDCPQGAQQIYLLGSYAGMEQHLARQRPGTEPTELVQQLITVQASATPTSVGTPVQLVKYSASGMEWIR